MLLVERHSLAAKDEVQRFKRPSKQIKRSLSFLFVAHDVEGDDLAIDASVNVSNVIFFEPHFIMSSACELIQLGGGVKHKAYLASMIFGILRGQRREPFLVSVIFDVRAFVHHAISSLS